MVILGVKCLVSCEGERVVESSNRWRSEVGVVGEVEGLFGVAENAIGGFFGCWGVGGIVDAVLSY